MPKVKKENVKHKKQSVPMKRVKSSSKSSSKNSFRALQSMPIKEAGGFRTHPNMPIVEKGGFRVFKQPEIRSYTQ